MSSVRERDQADGLVDRFGAIVCRSSMLRRGAEIGAEARTRAHCQAAADRDNEHGVGLQQSHGHVDPSDIGTQRQRSADDAAGHGRALQLIMTVCMQLTCVLPLSLAGTWHVRRVAA